MDFDEHFSEMMKDHSFAMAYVEKIHAERTELCLAAKDLDLLLRRRFRYEVRGQEVPEQITDGIKRMREKLGINPTPLRVWTTETV